MPFQLTYHSLASRKITGEDLKAIMKSASVNNSKHGITGCLIYHNNFFLQILEGEKEVVLRLLDTIKLDGRNGQLTVLSTDESADRLFKEWAMAFYHLPENEKLDEEEEKIKNDLIELSDSSSKPNFTLRVFWYNVRQLLRSEGYFRTRLFTDDL
ncbi:MAG: BLUF domain-containing protein [Flavobacteriaceae bacterium]